jgi:hypothetical protein
LSSGGRDQGAIDGAIEGGAVVAIDPVVDVFAIVSAFRGALGRSAWASSRVAGRALVRAGGAIAFLPSRVRVGSGRPLARFED